MLVEANSNNNVVVDFVSLMTFNLSGFDFRNDVMASFVIGMISASLNLLILQTSVSGMNMYQINHDKLPCFFITILCFFQASNDLSDVPFQLYAFELPNNIVGPRQLQSVVFKSFPRSDNELSIIKFILSCSPFMKKINIRVSNLTDDASENTKMNWELARKILKLHRASTTSVVEFF
jgi:hypothetical protein